MATKRASLILSVDGGAQFKQELQNATKETRLYKAELESVNETYKENANGIEALTEKEEALLKIQKSYQKQLEAAKAGHSNAVKEYEKQSQAVDDLSERLEKAKKELDEYQRSGGGDSSVTKSLQKEVDDVSTALEKQRLNLSKAEGKVTDWQKAQVKAAKDLQSVDRELDKNEKYLDEAKKSADQCATSIDKFGKETSEAAKDVGELSGTSSTMMDTLKGMVGADFITSGIHAISDAAKEAVEYVIGVGSEYEAAMSKVEALSGATGSELEALDEKARELGASTQFSASEVAEAMSSMALAGWSTKEMLDGIDGVLYLAAAGQMELADASDAVAGYLAAFNLEATDAAHLADVMATAQAKSKTTADQLAEAYSTSATNLTQYGQDLETTTSLLEAMASVNDTGSAAGTKLNAVMAQMVQKMQDGKIAIGDTMVAVKDQNGDFRSMIDILEDVEKATNGMADADRAAALQKTFNRTSLSGLNELLAVGSEQLRTYQTDLQNCDGASQDMAKTMNDNLKGDLTELNSAVEGLGIAAYERVKGPLRWAVDGLTTVVGGLTQVLEGPSDKFDEMTEAVSQANDKIKGVMDSVDEQYQAAEDDANRVGLLVEQLRRLNEAQKSGEGTEREALSRKMQMQAIIDELGDAIPEINDAWNSETGELKLTNEQLSAMVENYKEVAVQQAAMNAMQEVTNALVEAQIELEKGYAELDVMEKRKEGLEELQLAWGEFIAAYDDGSNFFKEDAEAMKAQQLGLLDEALKNLILTEEDYQELAEHAGDVQWLDWSSEKLSTLITGTTEDIQNQNSELVDLADNCGKAQKEYDHYGEIVTEATEKITKAAEETGDSVGGATDKVITFSLESKDATDGMSENFEDTGDSAEEMAEDVDASAKVVQDALDAEKKAAEEAAKEHEEANKAAAKSQADLADVTRTESDKVVQALTDIREEAKKTVETDFFGEFNGGNDEAIDDLLAKAQTNIEALNTYKDNLKIVSDHVGQEIAPEFLAYLESLGTNGANVLQKIADAFESDEGSEKVKEWSDAYLETLNIQESTANILAGDKIALQDGLAGLASTPVDFQQLRDNIDIAVANSIKGWEKLPEETRTKLEDMISICESIGVKIPDGLANGIINGQTEPEQAVDKLNAALTGRFSALIADAEAQGLEIPESITSGMNEGGDALIQAYADLIALITQTDSEAQSAANDKGIEIGDATGEGIGSATDTAETGAKTLTDAAVGQIEAADTDFSTAGEGNAGAYAEGMEGASSTVESAAEALAEQARTALSSQDSAFESIGLNIAYGVASGIRSGQSAVANAALDVAEAAVSAMQDALDINSPSGVFREEVGRWIPAGVAAGIGEYTEVATNAAKKLSQSIVQASTSYLKEQKQIQAVTARDEANYWKGLVDAVEVGTTAYSVAMSNFVSAEARASQDLQNTQNAAVAQAVKAWGVSMTKTEGSGDDQKTVLKDVQSYYNEVYSAAKRYFDNLNVSSTMSAEQQAEYWKIVRNTLQVGTDAWYDAQKNLDAAQKQIIKDQESYAKEAQRVAKEADRAQNEARQALVDGAEDYIRKKKILHQIDIDQEIAYWEQILNQLDVFTDQWYDVYEKRDRLREEKLEQENRALEDARKAEEDRIKSQQDSNSKLLSDWKTYFKMSLRAEMDYWNAARQYFDYGTDARIDADNRYYEAKEAYYDELKKLDEKYQSDLASIQDKMQDDVDDLTKKYEDAVKSREQSILSSMNLFDYWDSEGTNGKELLRNLESQVEGLERYTVVLENLKGRKILDDGLVEELENMGPNAAASLAGLMQLSDSELRKYNDLYHQRATLAHQQALSDNQQLLSETLDGIHTAQREANESLKTLNEQFQEDLNELNAVLDPALQHWLTLIGETGQNFFDGMNRGLHGEEFHSELRENVTTGIEGITEIIEAKCEGLEKALPDIGERALNGLMASMTDRTKIATATDELISAIRDELLNANYAGVFAEVPTVNFGELNGRMDVEEERKLSVDNSDVVDALDRAVKTIEMMTVALQGATVVLDTGETVGALQYAMSQAQADEYLTYNRGRI